MGGERRKLVTIVTEAALEQTLVTDLEGLGARGYTVTDARGKGSRGIRDAGWEPSKNVRIEIICTAEVAAAITDHVSRTYSDDYAMVQFTSDVEVVRAGKF